MADTFTFAARLRSFRYAFAGLRVLVLEQHNARIHLVAALAVVAAGLGFGVSAIQWCVLLLAIGGVFAAEALNSAVEYLADTISPERDPLIEKAKDVAAAGVLMMAFAAAAVGLLIFVPLLV